MQTFKKLISIFLKIKSKGKFLILIFDVFKISYETYRFNFSKLREKNHYTSINVYAKF